MRIAHTVSSLKGGGMEHFVIRLAAAQRARGHEPLVVSLAGGPLLDACKKEGLEVVVAQGNKLQRVLTVAARMARFAPAIVHAQPDQPPLCRHRQGRRPRQARRHRPRSDARRCGARPATGVAEP